MLRQSICENHFRGLFYCCLVHVIVLCNEWSLIVYCMPRT